MLQIQKPKSCRKMIRSNKQKYFFPLLFLLFSIFAYCQQVENYDLVILNGKILDGTGADAYYAALGINDDNIVRIERDTIVKLSGKKVVNAKGFTITPGFIDTHAHGDPLETPDFKNFIAMGVTTISLGQDGFSPGLDNLSQWAHNVNGATPAVNIVMFAGHNSLRHQAGINFDSIPREEDMRKMELLLKDAMAAGAFGMTTGLEYSPGEFSKQKELQNLAKIIGDHNGIIMSHMRNEDDDDVENSIKELLLQGEFCPVHISHIKVVYGKGETRAKEILNIIDEARRSGIMVTADFYPYTASYTGIAILFPDWAKQPHSFDEVVKTRRPELADFLRKKVKQRNGPEATLIGTGSFKSKTLAGVALALNKPFEDVLIDDIGPYGAGAAHFIMDEVLQRTFLTHAFINVCSDGSPAMRHPRGYGSFPKIIETYVLQENLLSLEEAVYKMTGLPAATLQLKNRGRIAENYKADILIFKPEELREYATYEDPHLLAGGMHYVIVNGKIAKDASNFTATRNGKVLHKMKQ
ncbi:D-aminoacylase [soil metagenome]